MTPPPATMAPAARRRAPAIPRSPSRTRPSPAPRPAARPRPSGATRPSARRPESPRPPDHRRRLIAVLVVFGVLFALVVGKLAELQVVSADEYRALGESQRLLSQAIPAERGVIYDRNRVALAMSRPASSVFVDPHLVDDPHATAAQVAPVLGLPIDEIEAKMRGEGRFAYLARKVPADQVDRLRALGLAGVAFLEEPERHHPSGGLARSILGSVDVDNTGISGLEALYDEQLTGMPGQVSFERNPDGQTIAVGEHDVVPAVKGDDLVLTLDRSMQYEVERILSDQVAATDSGGGIAVVSRPDTGEILAMANVVRDRETDEVLPGTNNAALTTAYEPGSVLKMVTIAAAIEAGLVTSETIIDVPPKMRIADAEFQDAEPHGGMSWPVSEVLSHSSNTGTIKIAQKVGKAGLYDELRAFGIGERTALGFPNEQRGSLTRPEDWWDTSLPTIAIGQGVAVTPLQMLFAYNAIANHGVYVAPRLVRSTVGADGVEHPLPLDEGRRVVSTETAGTMNVMLRDVVTQGTGKLAAVDGYTPAGKTGTSRKPQPGGGYVDADGVMRYQSTFVGFVPAERPALSIIVIMDEPSGGQYTGGVVSAPAFARIASYGLRLLGVPPPLTDAPAGGAPVDPAGGAAAPSVPEGSTVTEDGRVRGPRADQAPPSPPTSVTTGSDGDDDDGETTGSSPSGAG
jgi:cell division protein FtsI (penicillin-binding protein 3)